MTSEEQVEKFIEYVRPILLEICLREAKQDEPKPISVLKMLCFVLDRLKSGTFRGRVAFKIYDNKVWSPLIEESPELKRSYRFLE
jgi:hypothetical protein